MGVVYPSGDSQHERGAKSAIRGLKMGVTGFVWYQLCMFFLLRLSSVGYFFVASFFNQSAVPLAVSEVATVTGGLWKISSTAPRCTIFL